MWEGTAVGTWEGGAEERAGATCCGREGGGTDAGRGIEAEREKDGTGGSCRGDTNRALFRGAGWPGKFRTSACGRFTLAEDELDDEDSGAEAAWDWENKEAM